MRDDEPLLQSMEQCRDRALSALTDDAGRAGDAVAWLSAHVAAVEHVLGPRVLRVLGAGPVVEHRRATDDLLLRMQVLDRVCAGYAIPPGASLRMVRDDLVAALVDHAATEDAVVRELLRRVSETDARQLAARYVNALRRGPTRPHPHRARRGPLEPVRFTVDTIRDRIRDVLDARTVPLPRSPDARPPLLGRRRR